MSRRRSKCSKAVTYLIDELLKGAELDAVVLEVQAVDSILIKHFLDVESRLISILFHLSIATPQPHHRLCFDVSGQKGLERSSTSRAKHRTVQVQLAAR